jgi:hypothetical protein
MKHVLRLGLCLLGSAALLLARPTSSSRSSGSGSSYGSSKSYPSSSSSGASRPVAAPAPRPSSPSKDWGSSTTYTSDSKKAWGQSAPTAPATHTSAESSLNRTLNQTTTTPGGVSRATAGQERSAAVAPKPAPAATGPIPSGYHATTDYYTARTYRHYYEVQPSIWPGDIPLFYAYGGVRYSVIWDPFYHSYGWYGPNRTWVYYDSVPAVAMGPAPMPVAVVTHHRSGFWDLMFWLLFFAIFIALIAAIIWYVNDKRRRAQAASDVPVAPGPQERTSYKAPVEVRDEVGTLTAGSIIRLTDAISMADAIKLAPSSTGLFVTVDRVLTVREKNDLCQWTFVYGTSESENQALLIKIKQVGADRDIACYTRDVEGSRPDLLARDNYFLFGRPDNEENFDPMELRYAKQFTRKLDGDRDDTFTLVHAHELHGSAVYRPPQAGVSEVLATVAEWRNSARDTNEYLAIETGNGTSSNVETWWGERIRPDEIEFLSTAAAGKRR